MRNTRGPPLGNIRIPKFPVTRHARIFGLANELEKTENQTYLFS